MTARAQPVGCDEAARIAEARCLQAEGLSQRAIAKVIGKPRLWVRQQLGQAGADSASSVISVPVTAITASPNSRPIRDTKVAALVESIGQVGLI
jgi:hypothetical protein